MAKKLLFVFNPFAGKGQLKENLLDIIDIFTKGGFDWNVTNGDWSASYKILHEGNYTNYTYSQYVIIQFFY